jgi:hypothetical protein
MKLPSEDPTKAPCYTLILCGKSLRKWFWQANGLSSHTLWSETFQPSSLAHQSCSTMRPPPPSNCRLLIFGHQRGYHLPCTRLHPIWKCILPFPPSFATRRHTQWANLPIQNGHLGCFYAGLDSHMGEEPLVAFPLILPMGWVDSPNYLCAITETAADLANSCFSAGHLTTVRHPLSDLANTKPPAQPSPPSPAVAVSLPPPNTRSRGPLQQPLNYMDVYMDDFLHATQLPPAERSRARDTLFECIDQVLRPLAPTDNPHRKEPISTKKLLQGDAAWSTKKTVLGWLIDTTRRTIELPPHRLQRLSELLASFPHHQRRTSRRKWQQLLGELRSMILAVVCFRNYKWS